jgi:hypothetical protein
MKTRVAFLTFFAALVALLTGRPTAQSVSVEYLIVAGGGGGGGAQGVNTASGGGGAGGVLSGSVVLSSGGYPVTVGGGGVGGTGDARGGNGGNSSFNGLTAFGGGGGASEASGHPAQSGGSGGGGASDLNEIGASGTTGQGNAGGHATDDGAAPAGGGGGGKGSVGGYGTASGSTSYGGAGGAGITSSISGSPVGYAGGGGGGGGTSGGSASSGGGVGATDQGNGASGAPNSGGGGGGARDKINVAKTGGSGGSGIVIIRYPVGTLTATGGAITTAGGYTIHSFTSSGTFSISPVPTLSSVSPNTGNQGANVSVTLTGTNFVTGGTTVAVSGSDVTVSAVNVTSSTSLMATFAIAWTAATGARNVSVTTAHGTSGVQTFTVAAQITPPGWLMKQDSSGATMPSGAYEINGNIGIGTQAPLKKLHVSGDLHVDGNIAAKYQDVAEWVDATDGLLPGTVVIVAPAGSRVAPSQSAYDTAVIGVVSGAPGVMLGEAGPGKVLVAQSGRVRTRVDARYGAIRRGDLLVSSPTPGRAMRSAPIVISGAAMHRPGTLIGKALEELHDGTGEILVLLTLQ